MSGIHQFTSSQWVQTGAQAQFKTGINVTGSIAVDGTISAGTFIGDGSGLTGIGTDDFFAGNPTRIEDGTPTSEDTFIDLGTGTDTASVSDVIIATTHSATFTPNYYSFYKLTDNGFETIQSGSLSSYTGSDRVDGGDTSGDYPFENDLAPGVHRYMANAVNTGSGDGRSLFTTITIKAFINIPPTLVLPTNRTLSMEHDSAGGSIIFELTESSDANSDVGDFIRRVDVHRSTGDPLSTSAHRYSMVLKNEGLENTSNIHTESHAQGDGNVALSSSNGLNFTASISQYLVYNHRSEVILNQANFSENIHVTISDNNQSNSTASNSFNLTVVPPPTASITNIRTQVESGSYTNTVGTYYEVPMLYDRALTPTDTSSLDEIYRESLVRIRTCAEIQEPDGYTAAAAHKTKVKINYNTNDNIYDYNNVHWVQMDGHAGTAYTASSYGSVHSSTTNATESNGWIPIAVGESNRYYGPQTLDAQLLDIDDGVRHGSQHHFSASSGDPIRINVTAIPNVEISDIKVQIESSSFSGDSVYERTGSVLYGHTASLLEHHTASLEDYTKAVEYISESVIRYRVLATIKEPFGPDHKSTPVYIKKDGSNIHTLAFNTASTDLEASSSALNSENLRVSIYTSSWQSSSFDPGNYLISASFGNPATNTGLTTTTGTYSNLLINDTGSTDIGNIKLELETAYDTGTATNNRTSRILYDYTSSLRTIETASLVGYTKSNDYISESVIRYRVKAKVTEPFGPETTITTTAFNTPDFPTITLSTSSGDWVSTGSHELYDSDRKVLNYTSSWQENNFSSNLEVSASFTSTENILSIIPGVLSSLTMSATVAPIIHSTMSYENKWDGETSSSTDTTARSARILYGYTDTFLSSKTSSLRTQENYRATHSTDAVIRHRIKARVEEPFGPHTTTFTITPDHRLGTITLSTASADVYASSSAYQTNTSKSIIHYTSSWFEMDYVAGSYTQGHSISDDAATTVSPNIASDPTLTITSPTNPTITAVVEVEQTNSGSGNAGSSRTATFVHGRSQDTVTDPAIQSGWSSAAQNEMVRARVRAHVQETFGPKADDFTTNYITDVSNGASIPIPITSASGVNHSETNGSFAYEFTGAFEPIQLTSAITTGQTEANTIEINNFSDTFTTTPTTVKTSATVIMNARQTSSITINSITPYASHWSGSSGIVTLDPYIVSSNGTATIDDRILNISVNINPPDISSYTSMDFNNYTIAWADTSNNINATGNDTGSVDLQNIDIYTALETSTVSVEVASDISGDIGVANSTQTINVLPYNPISMASAGLTDNIPLATAYLPSSSTWNYEDVNQIGTSVNNIFRTWNGSANDYSLTLSFSDNFNHAESGSLILLINGSNSCSIDLESLFDETSKASNQTLPTVGPLSLTTWGVHNNISQPIYDGNELYTVGYQKFTPQISFTDKLPNDGYNTVQLKRIGIPGDDQLSDLYGFYYDDGAGTASIDAPTPNIWTWNESNSTSPTMSLSGVSYFVGGIPFEISYSGHIEGLASDTYPQPELVSLTTPSGLGLDFDGSYVTSQTNKGIDINSGLSWETGSTDPTIDDVANISLMAKFEGSSIVGVDKSIDIKALSKNDTYTAASTAAVGRFVNTGSIDSNPDSDTVANFYREDMRIPSSSNLDTLLEVSYGDYTYWLTSSNYTYDSTQSLLENNELQQTVDGHLIYPNASYTGSNIFNPNAPDYTDATGDRYWYRAISVQNITSNGDKNYKFKIGVGTGGDAITQADIWAKNPTGTGQEPFDSLAIRIRAKIPGPIGGTALGEGTPGTGWSLVTGGSGNNEEAGNLDNYFYGASTNFYAESGGYIYIDWNVGQHSAFASDNIVIVELRFKSTATQSRHHIKSLQILDIE